MFFKDVEFAWKRKSGVGRAAGTYRDVTMAKTKIIYSKNVGAQVAMDFT